jgi:cyclophilin family peptidyl-prolyl cis-trans isomerase
VFQRVLVIGGLLLVVAIMVVVLASKKENANKPKEGTEPVPPGERPVVLIETSMGDVKVELYPEKTPETVANFLQYVKDKHYDGTTFHRVISTFMIQGGGFEVGKPVDPSAEKRTRRPIKNEAAKGLRNERGTIAMARTPDPHSATAQFFINVKNNPDLDFDRCQDGWGYCAFGKVTEGMDVADKIKMVPTGREDRPLQDVVIKSIRRVDKEGGT